MKRFHVITHPVVEQEILEACEWIATDSPDAALRWTNTMEDAILSLSELPERCPIAPESDDVADQIRHLIVGNYRILFTMRENEVHILHIRHAAREQVDPDNN